MVRFLKKYIILFNSPGRLLFSKGIYPFEAKELVSDSKSNLYYLLILQKSRTQFSNLLEFYKNKKWYSKLFSFFKIIPKIFLSYIHLKITNQVILNYLIEQKLIESEYELWKNSNS